MYIDIRGMVFNNSLSVACTENPWLFYYFIILILGRPHEFGYFWTRMFFFFFFFFFFTIERGWMNERNSWFRVERRPVLSEIWGYFKKYPDYVDWALFVVKHKTTISKYIFLIALFIRGLFQTGTKLDLHWVSCNHWVTITSVKL